MKTQWKNLSKLVLIIFLWFFTLKILLNFFSEWLNSLNELLSLSFKNMVIPYFIILPLLYIFIKDIPIEKIVPNKTYSLNKIFNYNIVLNGLVLSFFLLGLMIFFNLMNFIGYDDLRLADQGSKPLLYELFLLLIFNPIFEGLFFRKILLERIVGFEHRNRAIIGGSLFMLPHLLFYTMTGIKIMNLPILAALIFAAIQASRLFILGTALAHITIDTGYLKYAAILHSLSNFHGYFLSSFLSDYPILFLMIYFIIMPIWGIYILKKTKLHREFLDGP